MAEFSGEIERPVLDDVETIARLFGEDMASLRVEVGHDEMVELARNIVNDVHSEHPAAVCWVARDTDSKDAVGVILANFEWSLKFAGRALWIEELYVTPSARRQGLGRLLVEHLLDWAEENGVKGIDLEAYQGNTPASILYRSLGFHRLGRERFYYLLGPDEFL
jgi:ribosomal protein S18 acetylase RimI-like enzyme